MSCAIQLCVILCSRPLIASLHQICQLLDIELVHSLRECQDSSKGLGHTHLIDIDRRICGDHGSTTEIHSLSHEIASHTTRLALHSLSEGLERTLVLLCGLGHALPFVVAVVAIIDLQQLQILVHLARSLASVFLREREEEHLRLH